MGIVSIKADQIGNKCTRGECRKRQGTGKLFVPSVGCLALLTPHTARSPGHGHALDFGE